jgi:hypothetical protein
VHSRSRSGGSCLESSRSGSSLMRGERIDEGSRRCDGRHQSFERSALKETPLTLTGQPRRRTYSSTFIVQLPCACSFDPASQFPIPDQNPDFTPK